jgi:hypothetical protein
VTTALLVVLALVLGLVAGFVLAAVGLCTFLGYVYRWCDADEWSSVGAILAGAPFGANVSWPRGDA